MLLSNRLKRDALSIKPSTVPSAGNCSESSVTRCRQRTCLFIGSGPYHASIIDCARCGDGLEAGVANKWYNEHTKQNADCRALVRGSFPPCSAPRPLSISSVMIDLLRQGLAGFEGDRTAGCDILASSGQLNNDSEPINYDI